MPTPCTIIKSVDSKTRTITYKKGYEAAFLSFEKPGHCVTCRRAIKLFESDEPHNEVDA